MSTLLPYAGVENSRLLPDYKGGEFASLRYVASSRGYVLEGSKALLQYFLLVTVLLIAFLR